MTTNITAKTSDGRIVILKEDGTWRFQESSDTIPENTSEFRNTNWGATRDEVVESEGYGPIYEMDSFIGYQVTIANLKFNLLYFFVRNTLVRAAYSFTQKHSNENEYLSDFQVLKKLLREKYGKSTSEDTYWYSNKYKDDQDKWGLAVSLGDLTQYVRFEDEDSEIGFTLRGYDHKILLSITHTNKEFAHIEVEESKAKVEKLIWNQ